MSYCRQCFAEGRKDGITFHANEALAKQLAYSGFVCDEPSIENATFICRECPIGTMASTPLHGYGVNDLTSICYNCSAGIFRICEVSDFFLRV